MSREFDWRGSAYMHSILASGGDREKTGEPVADALGHLYSVLAPLEYAVATHQAGDSGVDSVMLAAVEDGARGGAAMNDLLDALSAYQSAVQGLIRRFARGGAP